jgi:hypothetical protein
MQVKGGDMSIEKAFIEDELRKASLSEVKKVRNLKVCETAVFKAQTREQIWAAFVGYRCLNDLYRP